MTVNGNPSPCECEEGVVCAYCVQANLILWERREHPEEAARDHVLKAIKRNGLRKSARLMGVSKNKVDRWLKTGNIPMRDLEEAQRAICPL